MKVTIEQVMRECTIWRGKEQDCSAVQQQKHHKKHPVRGWNMRGKCGTKWKGAQLRKKCTSKGANSLPKNAPNTGAFRPRKTHKIVLSMNQKCHQLHRRRVTLVKGSQGSKTPRFGA